jgi:hypothetical protein
VILIQRIKKIKQNLGKKYFREILIEISFYLFFFFFGVFLVWARVERSENNVLIISEKTTKNSNKDLFLEENTENKRYVSSSRGKYFYETGSSRAEALSDKNKIYFSTPEEAKKLGFLVLTLS